MSTKIKLWFETFPNPVLEEKIPDVGEFTRLFCAVKFKTPKGWSKTMAAIIDTGAPISVIPLDIWLDLEKNILTEYDIKGINPRDECAVPALVGKINCVLLDEKSQSDYCEILAYLAHSNLVPLLLGFKDLLVKFPLYFNYETQETYIELKR